MAAISKLSSPSDIQDERLRSRAERAHAGRSEEFIAYECGMEVGLLSYENWGDQASAFIYEIFVLPQHRRQGVGALLLSHAERYALLLQCRVIRLKPLALDVEPNQSRIEGWYTKLGYRRAVDDAELMEKYLPVSCAI